MYVQEHFYSLPSSCPLSICLSVCLAASLPFNIIHGLHSILDGTLLHFFFCVIRNPIRMKQHGGCIDDFFKKKIILFFFQEKKVPSMSIFKTLSLTCFFFCFSFLPPSLLLSLRLLRNRHLRANRPPGLEKARSGTPAIRLAVRS
jgi:hypothetical protein